MTPPTHTIYSSLITQLAHYLDLVEMQLASEISRRSARFFDIMVSQDVSHHYGAGMHDNTLIGASEVSGAGV